jgi:N-acetyltransferase
LTFSIINNETNRVVGSTRYLFIQPEHKNLEIGFTFYDQHHRRTSCNTETKILLLTDAFERLKCLRVQFKVDLRNIASQNAMLRIGAKKEGILRKWQLLHDGHERNVVIFSIVNEEWPELKSNLLQKLTNKIVE